MPGYQQLNVGPSFQDGRIVVTGDNKASSVAKLCFRCTRHVARVIA